MVPLLKYDASFGDFVKMYKSDKPNDWDGILWPGNNSLMPVDKPPCGWNNELCQTDENSKTFIFTATGSCCLLLLICFFLAIFLYRRLR
jgi:hypothetical protein